MLTCMPFSAEGPAYAADTGPASAPRQSAPSTSALASQDVLDVQSAVEVQDALSAQNAKASASTAALKRYCKKIIASETAWLTSTQLDNGAFPEYKADNGTVTENPYYSDFVCLALLDGGEAYASDVKRYLDWHFAHLNSAADDANGLDGTIYDYRAHVSSGNQVVEETVVRTKNGTGIYDSTDSYAALFLTVLERYYEVTGDTAYIQEHKRDIGRIVKVIFKTTHGGLTYATPSYQVKYLMDNAEVYEGLAAAEKLYRHPLAGESITAAQVKRHRLKLRRKMATALWTSQGGGHYRTALDCSGAKTVVAPFRWTRFYPDAAAQLFPLINGVISPRSARAKRLYAQFNRYWSNGTEHHRWEKLDTTDENAWGDVLYAAVLMNDRTRAGAYMKTYLKRYGETHAHPLYNADSAKVLRAAYLLRSRLA